VPPDDVAALSGALRRLASDPTLRTRLGQAAEREARERYTLDAMVRRYVSLYDEVVQRRS
jgi:glycosyltransferase involved in cell wall biosynthesis